MSERVPDGWALSALGDFINIGRGFAFKSSDYKGAGVPIIRVTNISDSGTISFAGNLVYLDEQEAESYSGFRLIPDDILIVMVGATVGKLARVSSSIKASLLNQNMWRLTVKNRKNSSQKFAYHCLKPVVNKFLSSQQGSARSFLTQKDFSQAEILLPPFIEQQKIAKILTSVDEVIEKTQAQIDKLKDLKTGMMQELLTKGVGVDGKPHTEFKDSPVGRIPKKWDVVTLGDITIDSAFGPRFSSSEYALDGNIGCIRTTDMDENWDINYATAPRAKLSNEEFKKHFLEEGDLLVTRSGTCGLVDVFKQQSLPMIAAAFLIRFRLVATVNPHFVRYLMMSSGIQENIQLLASGGVQKNLSGSSLKTLKLPMPDIDEQSKIVNVIESINRRLFTLNRKQIANQQLKKALMQDLLTGKVRVTID